MRLRPKKRRTFRYNRVEMIPVSVIVPCYNEQDTIGLLLEAVSRQTYPLASIEVIISDGLSTDQTLQVIASFQNSNPQLRVRIVENPRRSIPSALNRAIEAAQGEILVRLDAHSVPQADYVERCVAALEGGLGDNVGGVWDIRPGGQGWMARSIAAAASNRLAVGDARYRYTTEPGAVDTVPFGAFRKSLVEQVGYFDETLLTNEDYEFNARIRQKQGTIWLDPAIRSVYFARDDLGKLARQYWRYGYWKQKMLRRYPQTLRWRQVLPPAFILNLASFFILSFFSRLVLWLTLAEILVYAGALCLAGIYTALKRRDAALAAGVPAAIAVMHFSWGAGLWGGLLQDRFMKARGYAGS